MDLSAIIRLDAASERILSRILNASTNGLLLAMPEARPIGTRVSITIATPEERDLKLEGMIVHTARLSHADPRLTARVGIFLTQVGDAWPTFIEQHPKRRRRT